MDTKRRRMKKAFMAAVVAVMLVVPASRLSALKFPEGYHCSNNLIDCRGTLCYYGCGGIAWADTWHHYFG
jgi:hypothetical protein